jgi:hypothetical protein
MELGGLGAQNHVSRDGSSPLLCPHLTTNKMARLTDSENKLLHNGIRRIGFHRPDRIRVKILAGRFKCIFGEGPMPLAPLGCACQFISNLEHGVSIHQTGGILELRQSITEHTLSLSRLRNISDYLTWYISSTNTLLNPQSLLKTELSMHIKI